MTSDRRFGSAALLLLTALSMAACVKGNSPPSKPTFEKNVNVGAAPSTPGWNDRDQSGRRTGFDYDLTNWLGEHVGFTPVAVDSIAANRETDLLSGKVTLVVATYSITDSRREKVGFAGPYMVSKQGIMIRGSDQGSYKKVADLAGKTLCAIRNSTSSTQLRELGFPVTVIERDVYRDCIAELRSGAIDAISTDQLILYGHLQQFPDLAVPQEISFGRQEQYGVGLPKGDVAKCEALTKALKIFLVDGFWETFFRNNLPGLGSAGHKPDPNYLNRCEA